jgi:hypothetical protein
MTVEKQGRRTMLRQDNTGASARSKIAWALQEWNTALAYTQNSAEAEIYTYAIDLVVAYLDDRQTIAALLDAYYSPTAKLSYLVGVLCTAGETPLRPRLLMGASCAVRLRELMRQVIT